MQVIFYFVALQVVLNLKLFVGIQETEQEAQTSDEHRSIKNMLSYINSY